MSKRVNSTPEEGVSFNYGDLSVMLSVLDEKVWEFTYHMRSNPTTVKPMIDHLKVIQDKIISMIDTDRVPEFIERNKHIKHLFVDKKDIYDDPDFQRQIAEEEEWRRQEEEYSKELDNSNLV